MSDAVYERYKDALRRGHVAALRGRLDAALVAYRDAAGIAPERALPHASMGSVLAKLGRTEDALAAYAVALDRAPRDEAALEGRAEVLASLGRRVEAADALDRLAEAHAAAGRLPEAADTARRALELAESKERRRHVEQLSARLREVPADEAAAAALERTLGVLESPVGPAADGEGVERADAALDALPLPPDPVALAAEAEDRLDQGDVAAAREGFLAAAIAYREAGAIDAALDACYLALGIAPSDADLHLVLAELYLDRGWHGPAADKLLLLDRLVELGDDEAARERVRSLAAARLGDDPRLAARFG